MCRRDIQGQVRHKPRESWRLPLRKLQDQARQGRGVDDRMLEWALQAATDQPGVEGVVAVLDEDGALGEAQEGPSRVAELRGSDEHRAVDVMAPVRVWVDRRLAVHERVEKREGAIQAEAFRANLQHEERRVARCLHVKRDKLRLVELRMRAHLGRVDGDLLPGDGLHGPARLQKDRLRAHRVSARARRAQSISSLVTPRRMSTAAP
jgi:hypothetical protein